MPSNSTEYNKKYWQRYKQRRRRVYGYLSPTQYEELAARAKAHGHSVFQQLWQESQAYQQQRYLPSATIEALHRDLINQLRRLGNNVNQIARHTNTFRSMVTQRQVFEQLQNVENLLKDFTYRMPRLSNNDHNKMKK